MFKKIDCCPKCSMSNVPYSALRRVAEIEEESEQVTAFYSCCCGHKWTSSYLIQSREVVNWQEPSKRHAASLKTPYGRT